MPGPVLPTVRCHCVFKGVLKFPTLNYTVCIFKNSFPLYFISWVLTGKSPAWPSFASCQMSRLQASKPQLSFLKRRTFIFHIHIATTFIKTFKILMRIKSQSFLNLFCKAWAPSNILVSRSRCRRMNCEFVLFAASTILFAAICS